MKDLETLEELAARARRLARCEEPGIELAEGIVVDEATLAALGDELLER